MFFVLHLLLWSNVRRDKYTFTIITVYWSCYQDVFASVCPVNLLAMNLILMLKCTSSCTNSFSQRYQLPLVVAPSNSMSSVTVSVTNQHRTHALRYFIETSGSGNTRYSLRVQYSEWTVGLLSSATCCPIFVQFTGCHQPVERSYWPEKCNWHA